MALRCHFLLGPVQVHRCGVSMCILFMNVVHECKRAILPTKRKSDIIRLWSHSGSKVETQSRCFGIESLRFEVKIPHPQEHIAQQPLAYISVFGMGRLHSCFAHPALLQVDGHKRTANNIQTQWLMVTQSSQHCIPTCFAENIWRIQTNNPNRHPFFPAIFNIYNFTRSADVFDVVP